MTIRDCADKITGLVAMGGWCAVATSAAEGSAAALLAEPVTGALVLGSALALQLTAGKNDVCARAIDAHRNKTEKAIKKALGDQPQFREAIDLAFSDFDYHIADVRPTGEDLVRLWQFDPQKIAEGLMERLAAKSDTIRDHHIARQAVAHVIAGAVASFRDDAVLFARLEPVLAREYLAQLSAIRAVGEDTNRVVHRTDAKIDALTEMVRALTEQAQTRGDTARAVSVGIDPGVIVTLAQRISADIQDFDQAFRELENAVSIAITVQREGAGGSNAGAFVDAVLKRVAALSARGKFVAASKEAGDAFAQWQRDEAERQAASRQSGLKLLEAGWRQDLLAGDLKSAARKIAQGVYLNEPDPSRRFAALRKEQDVWYKRGRDQGINLDLDVSIELARLSLAIAEGNDQRGSAWNNLGNALQTLGERESGTGRLEEAVAAYREALKEWTRERVPLDWAATQNNLGNALQTLGARESGTARLEQAVAAYRAALEERTRERVPLDWAATQNNLGNALTALGEREDGTELLEEAVTAYREALKEYTRERVPLGWAETHLNLAVALEALFDKTGKRGDLDKALDLTGQALDVFASAGAGYHVEMAERAKARILAKLAKPA